MCNTQLRGDLSLFLLLVLVAYILLMGRTFLGAWLQGSPLRFR